MQLTVEEIVAKVALQRDLQKKQNQQRQMIEHITNQQKNRQNGKSKQVKKVGNKQHGVISANMIPQKSQLNKKNHLKMQTFVPQSLNAKEIKEKYKILRSTYKKLSKKIQHQTQVDKMYSQILPTLQKVIKKNNKLQRQIDHLKMKKIHLTSIESSNTTKQQLKMKEDISREDHINKSKKNESVRRKNNSSLKFEDPDVCQSCETNTKAKKQMLITMERSNIKGDGKEHEQIQNVKSERNHQSIESFNLEKKKQSDQYQMQLQLYKYMVMEKEASIVKLNTILSKQQELLNSYQSFSKPIQEITQEINCIRKVKMKLGAERSSGKIQGTIVKIKKKKGSHEQNSNRGIISMNLSNVEQLLGADFVEMYLDQKTKKKNDIKPLSRQGTKQQQDNLSGSNNFSGRIVHQREKQFNFLQEKYCYQSPSESINETSEFICDEI